MMKSTEPIEGRSRLTTVARAESRRSSRAAVFLLVVPLLALAVAEPAQTQGSDPQTEPVVADLPILPVPFSSQIHLDLAPIGDTPIPVILDTGISYSVGSPAAVSALRGKPSADDDGMVVRHSVLGDLAFRRYDQIERALSSDRWLRFGGQDLERFVIEIDFVRQRVRFLDARRSSIPEEPSDSDPEVAVIPLEIFRSRPRVELEVNGRTMKAALDTSVTAPLWIGTRDLKLAAIHPKTLPILRPKGDGQRTTTRLYETDSVRIGGIALAQMPVLVETNGQVDEFGASGPAIGLDLLSQFQVRLDIGRGQLWLRRLEKGPARFLGADYAFTRVSGAFLFPIGDRWSVAGVLPESPAEQAGLRPGDLLDPAQLADERPEALLEALRLKQPVIVQRPASVGGQTLEVSLPAPPAASEPAHEG